jgi:hypothetical protein
VSTIHLHQPIPYILVYLKRGQIILDKNIHLLGEVDLGVSFNNSGMDCK